MLFRSYSKDLCIQHLLFPNFRVLSVRFVVLVFVLAFVFFLAFLLSRVAGRVLVLQPGVGPEPPRWEGRVQDIGPPETSWPHVISIRELSQRSSSQHKDPVPPKSQQAPVLDALCQTSKTGTQTHPLAERLPKVILSSQTKQNN